MAHSLFKSLPALFSISDEQAMWRVKMENDSQAFTQLVKRWERPICALCTRMLGDSSRAEDLTQETFVRVFAKRKEYEPSGRFSTFLWRVALNRCYDELRKINRRRESALEHDETGEIADARLISESPAPDSSLVQQEQVEAVRSALLQLSEAYRAVVVLRHYEGLKFREISEVLEIPEGTVKSRMAEALSQLNRILSRSLDERDTICNPRTRPIKEILAI